MKRNFLNAPVIAIATLGMFSGSSISIHNMNFDSNQSVYQYKCTSDDYITNNFSRDINMKVQKINLEENTSINSPISGLLNTENSKYIMKNNLEGFINGIKSSFGEMRYLTEEGQKDYNDNLDELYTDVGVQLFDFV